MNDQQQVPWDGGMNTRKARLFAKAEHVTPNTTSIINTNDWPVQAQPFSVAKHSKKITNWLIVFGVVVGFCLYVAISSIGDNVVSQLIGLAIGVVVGVAIIQAALKSDGHTSAEDGLLLKPKNFFAAYPAVKALSTQPSTLSLEEVDDTWSHKEKCYPLDDLWYQDDGREHSYTLYWRDAIYGYFDDMLRKSIKGDQSLESMGMQRKEEILRDQFGVDLRMRPVTLQVRGDRARLVFDDTAKPVKYASRDMRIKETGGWYPAKLIDTFAEERS